ncbi:MAG: hypothetical protein JSS49_14275 [Planctomycetes bacterium]|nr:hypothetical protein [Planctomycetota bacterium]
MPDPQLYLTSMGTAAIVSAIIVLMMAAIRRPAGAMRLNAACVLAMAGGIAMGQFLLTSRSVWPPTNALDRFLVVVIPAALAIELAAGLRFVSPVLIGLMRLSLAAAIPRILLHGSVYLNAGNGWSWWQAGVMAGSGLVLAAVWVLLAWLSQRSQSHVSIALALALATQCAGVSVMMAGYLKGGAAAFPLASALVVTSISARLVSKQFTSALIGIGVVNLFGVIFIGSFFGRLAISHALALLLAPLMCWTTEIIELRQQRPWVVGALRLTSVTVPLVLVLALVKRDFDRDMRPLINQTPNLQGDRLFQIGVPRSYRLRDGRASAQSARPCRGSITSITVAHGSPFEKGDGRAQSVRR